MRKVIGMKRLLAMLGLILVAATAFGQAPDWYIGKTIKTIRFDGLVVVTQKDVDPIIKAYRGKAFDEALWMELLSRVYELDYFDEIAPEAVPADASYSAVQIVFKVKEKPAVSSVTLSGNAGLRTQELLDVLSVKERTIFNASKLRLDEIALRRLYQEKGYPEVKIVASQQTVLGGDIAVTFSITEGVRNIVEAIRFEGVEAVSESTLKGEMKLKEKGLFQAGQFSEGLLEESRRAVEAYYHNRGYVDAKVVDVRRESSINAKDGSTRLALTLVVSEGRRYLYGGMSFQGNRLYSDEELGALLRLKSGVVINNERLLQDQMRVSDRYFENGYIFNGFKLQEARNEEAGTIAYVLLIEERPQAFIEDIIFRGNDKTKDYVLERLMELEPGDVFSKTKLLESLRALYNTQYFSSIVPEYEQGSKDLYVDLVVNVIEQSTASIQFGLTYTPASASKASAFPIVGLVNWSDINFLGRGQTLALKSNLAFASQDLTFSFSDDWLFGKRLSGSVDFSFAHKAVSVAQDSSGVIFPYGSAGGTLAVPDPYDSYEEYVAAGYKVPDAYKMSYDAWTFSLGYSSGWRQPTFLGTVGLIPGVRHDLEMKTYDETRFRPYDSSIADNRGNWKFSNTFYLRAYLNNLDLWYNPSKGYYLSQRLGLTGWFPDEMSYFMRSDTRLDGYVTLFDIPVGESWSFKAVAAGHTKFSALLPQPWRDDVSLTDTARLAIDGTFVGRGWSSLSSSYGTTLWDNWLELRVPVLPSVLSLDGFLSGALVGNDRGFLNIDAQAHNTTTGYGALSLENVAFSMGGGVRFLILQFPFRLYFAKQFTYNNDAGFRFTDKEWQFVLSVTTSLD